MKPFVIEPDALDRLVARMLYEITEEGNTAVLRDVLAGQVAIVTDLQRKVERLEAFVLAMDENGRDEGPCLYHDLRECDRTDRAIAETRAALDWMPQP